MTNLRSLIKSCVADLQEDEDIVQMLNRLNKTACFMIAPYFVTLMSLLFLIIILQVVVIFRK